MVGGRAVIVVGWAEVESILAEEHVGLEVDVFREAEFPKNGSP